jgi:hypothetical protein
VLNERNCNEGAMKKPKNKKKKKSSTIQPRNSFSQQQAVTEKENKKKKKTSMPAYKQCAMGRVREGRKRKKNEQVEKKKLSDTIMHLIDGGLVIWYLKSSDFHSSIIAMRLFARNRSIGIRR